MSQRRVIIIIALGVLGLVVCLILPRTRTIHSDEQVAYLGPYLYWDQHDKLNLFLRGRLFEPERDSATRRLAIDDVLAPSLLRYVHKQRSQLDEAACDLMYERLSPFLYDGESRVWLAFRLRGRGGQSVISTPMTNAGGYFAMSTASAPDRSINEIVGDGDTLEIAAVLRARDTRQFNVTLAVPPRSLRLLVISDMDDTVRVGEVLDRPRMIERVFLLPYEAVEGMAELYNALADHGAWFHFVSGSPWQIAPLVEEFLSDSKFPPATLHCREIGWDFWNSDPVHTKQFKIATIEALLKQVGGTKVLLIGDDGEHDPEVYTEICRAHPDRVVGIWIRRVRPSWDAERLAEAAVQIGDSNVVAFETADELMPFAERLKFDR